MRGRNRWIGFEFWVMGFELLVISQPCRTIGGPAAHAAGYNDARVSVHQRFRCSETQNPKLQTQNPSRGFPLRVLGLPTGNPKLTTHDSFHAYSHRLLLAETRIDRRAARGF